MQFVLVETKEAIRKIEKMAKTIWNEAYHDLLSQKQIDYMLSKFLTKEAIKAQINEGYQYFLVKDDKNCGFAAIQVGERVFLSKFYLDKTYYGKGLLRGFVDILKKHQKPIYLTVNKHNYRAINAYLKLGFIKEKEVVSDIGGGFVMDDYVMVLYDI